METDTGSETDTGAEEDSGNEEEEIVGNPVTFTLTEAEGMKIGLLRVQFTDDGIDFADNMLSAKSIPSSVN